MMDSATLESWLGCYQQPYSQQLQLMQAIDAEPEKLAQLLAKAIDNKPDVSAQLTACLNWQAQSKQHQIITYVDLPEVLKAIADPPLLLFAAGDLSLLTSNCLAVIGSRNPTHAGQENAQQFCEVLALSGWTLVSGMAKGIDGISHRVALANNTPTIAVLGTGHLHAYPPEHRTLQQQIAESGLVISEYLPDTPVAKYQFPRRNRLISALVKGVLVIEAASKSGTLITCDYAAEQGRDVFAVPGDIDNPKVAGCHQLIRDGATLVCCAAQINGHYELQTPQLAFDFEQIELTTDEQQVYNCLERKPILIDAIISRTKLQLELVLSVLFSLELKGLVTSDAGGYLKRQPE